MCGTTQMIFGLTSLTPTEIRGRRVLEVGSRNVNGSYREFLADWGPGEYVGVDFIEGPGVDIVWNAERLVDKFGKEQFDVVVSTEMLEHVRDWRSVVSNLKQVCRRGGTLIVTTRSAGFPYHGWPYDFWRYEIDDFRRIFADCTIVKLESDRKSPGVFMKATVPDRFEEVDLSDYELYSIVRGERTRDLQESDFKSPRYRNIVLMERCDKFWRKFADSAIWYSFRALQVLRGQTFNANNTV